MLLSLNRSILLTFMVLRAVVCKASQQPTHHVPVTAAAGISFGRSGDFLQVTFGTIRVL